MTTFQSTSRTLLALLPALLSTLMATATPAQGDDRGYSFVRVIEGSPVLLDPGGSQQRLDLHQPVLVGDRVRVPYGSRLELVLADHVLLRLDGDSEVELDAVADSLDTADRATHLYLPEGEIQLVVPRWAKGRALPRIETPDATVDILRPGRYRLIVSRRGGTELVVREGLATMWNDDDRLTVEAGDMTWVRGGAGSPFDLRPASPHDDLERWGDHLSARAAAAAVPLVDEPLRYAAEPLAGHGAWLTIGGRQAWRPRVEIAWRPFHHGYWRHTPVGYTWVSYDPWGYLTHHYGSWDYALGYGWVWYPGHVYAPARVVWYWGPDYVGWAPQGYYHHHFGRHHRGYRLGLGLYGYGGGDWSHYVHWSFCDTSYFGRPGYRDRIRSGVELGRHHRASPLRRGYITTDPGHRRDPVEVLEDLRRSADTRTRRTGDDLPDVSDFVARRIPRRELEPVTLDRPPVVEERGTLSERRGEGGSVPGGLPGNVPGAERRRELTPAREPREDVREPFRARPAPDPRREATPAPAPPRTAPEPVPDDVLERLRRRRAPDPRREATPAPPPQQRPEDRPTDRPTVRPTVRPEIRPPVSSTGPTSRRWELPSRPPSRQAIPRAQRPRERRPIARPAPGARPPTRPTSTTRGTTPGGPRMGRPPQERQRPVTSPPARRAPSRPQAPPPPPPARKSSSPKKDGKG